MAKIGYARVSTHLQNKELQLDALTKAGCERIFTDEITGSKADRQGLNDALAFLRPGDTFIVWKMDRAGRSLMHLLEILKTLQEQGVGFVSLTESIDTTTPGGKLIFHLMGAIAEFERDLIRERTNAGLSSARARGRTGGRPRKLKNGKVALARSLHADKSHSIDDICETLHISRPTLYRYLREENQP